ncbi:MAG: glycosyl hydrolase [Porcipelethomonas sp.]
MKRFFRRCAAVLTASFLSSAAIAFPTSAAEDGDVYTQFPLTMECEDMDLHGDKVWTSIYETQLPGYSGEGFVYLTGSEASFEVVVPEDGMYEITTSYAQILDETGRDQTISINGTEFMMKFPYADEWTEASFGMFRLKAGTNEIKLLPKYGYAAYDTITIKEAVYPDLTNIDPTPCDSNATDEVRSLLSYLTNEVYGQHILSGQQEIYGGGNDGNYELEFDFIHDLSGEYPAIRGFDMMNYNPLYGWDDNTTERIIEWTNERNGIATVCWHINVPQDFASYEIGDAVDWKQCTYDDKSDFDTSQAIIEGTKENQYVLMAIEDLAEQLQRVQEAGVPVIFRPFHEAEGNGGLDGSGAWFWWSKSGCEVYKSLWKLLYTELTEKYGIHNLIWEENLYAWSDESAQWYIGDDYVDIVGFDKYNTEYNRHDGNAPNSGPNEDAESSIFYKLVNYVNNNKMVSMPENDTIPSLSNMEIENAYWLYFCPWYGDHILSESKNNPETVKELYQSDFCITLDELPEDWLSYPAESGGTKIIPGDLSGDKKVNVFDSILMKKMLLDPVPSPDVLAPSAEDVDGDGTFTVSDLTLLNEYLLGKDVKLTTYVEQTS